MKYFAFSDELPNGQLGWVVSNENGDDCTEDTVVGFYPVSSKDELLARLEAQGVNPSNVEVDE